MDLKNKTKQGGHRLKLLQNNTKLALKLKTLPRKSDKPTKYYVN